MSSGIARVACLCSIPADGAPACLSDVTRSLHEFWCAVRSRRSTLRLAQPSGAGGLYGGDLSQRAVVVLGAAAVHQDGAAAARRLARGVVRRDGVLPDAAAGGLRLCAFADADQ